MVQEQLVDYVSSQMKLGVSRDAIKSALVTAGWVPADVEDTLKKVEGSGPAVSSMPAASPMSTASAVASSSPSKSSEPQMIRMSDLVSSSSPAMISPTKKDAPKDSPKIDAGQFGGKISGNTFQATSTKAPGGSSMNAAPKSKAALITGIVGGVLVILFAGLAWYFYSGNAALAKQVQSLNSQSGSVSQQIATMQAQLNASTTALQAQMASLTASNADLALNLSFYAVPPGTSATSVPTDPITVSGVLSGGGKVPYSLTTSLGGKIYITNSDDASTAATLKPLVGQTIQLSGTYMPGSDAMTITSVASSTTQ